MDRSGDPGRHDLKLRRARVIQRLRADPTLLAFAGSLVVAFAALEFYARHFWFFGDEFAFLASRRLSEEHGLRAIVDQLLTPHNEHPSAIPQLWYWLAESTWGLWTYWPYVTAAVLLHLLVATLVFVLARRMGSSKWISWAVATLFALFGPGWENIFWGFQVGFSGAMALSLAAVLAWDHDGGRIRRDVAGAIAAVAAIATVGIAIPLLAGAFVMVLLRRNLRVAVALLAGPAIIAIGWRLAYPPPPGIPRAHTSDAFAYAVAQLSAALQAMLGVPGTGGVAFIVLLGALGCVWVRGVPCARQYAAVALVVAALLLALVTGLGRATLGLEQAGSSRYLHLQAALLLPVIALLLTRIPTLADRRKGLLVAIIGFAIISSFIALRPAVRDRSGLVLALRDQVLAATNDPLVSRYADPSALVNAQYLGNLSVGMLKALADDGRMPAKLPPPAIVRDMRKQFLIESHPMADSMWRPVRLSEGQTSGAPRLRYDARRTCGTVQSGAHDGPLSIPTDPSLGIAVTATSTPPLVVFVSGSAKVDLGTAPPGLLTSRAPGAWMIEGGGAYTVCAYRKVQ